MHDGLLESIDSNTQYNHSQYLSNLCVMQYFPNDITWQFRSSLPESERKNANCRQRLSRYNYLLPYPQSAPMGLHALNKRAEPKKMRGAYSGSRGTGSEGRTRSKGAAQIKRLQGVVDYQFR